MSNAKKPSGAGLYGAGKGKLPVGNNPGELANGGEWRRRTPAAKQDHGNGIPSR